MSKIEVIEKFIKLRNDNSKFFRKMLEQTEYNCLVEWYKSEVIRLNK